ncbi:MAG: transposase [Clostridia bacterium]|nr:transposase [Clostridia bacterium]
MATNEKQEKLRVLFLITTPKMATKAAALFDENSVPIHYRMGAMGTASSEVMDILGLGSAEKRMLLCVLQKPMADMMLLKLHKALKIGTVNSGIAYTIPIDAASRLAFRMLEGLGAEEATERKETRAVSDKKNAMIAAVVNLGYSEDVMTAARAAGAGGGTVLHSRSVVDDSALPHVGAGLAEEKDIVLIVANSETKLAIMQAISEKCGIRSEAKGIVYSFPIDNVIGLSD